jgi:hypothetical protein
VFNDIPYAGQHARRCVSQLARAGYDMSAAQQHLHAIDMQQQQINEIWKHIQFGRNETKASGVQDAQRTQMVDVFQPHEQQRMHLTAITQKVRKLSKVFIHSYIRTFLMYTHSGLHSATPRSLILSLSHTHRHRWVKKCMHSKTGSTDLRMALSLR